MSEVITIDGPSSSGKNSVGELLAKKLGFQFIDTGSIYRAGSLVALRQNSDINSEEQLVKIFENLNVEFKKVGENTHLFLNEEDITALLHSSEVTAIVAKVSAYPKVREVSKRLQKKVVGMVKTVMAGRDIGSEIFPDAILKFFITASNEVRAKRRYDQLVKKGPNITYEQVLAQMLQRDKQDVEREASPMRIPEDAIIIDTSNLTIEESVGKMMEEYKKRPNPGTGRDR